MTTFVQWLHEQEPRQDTVGQFATRWFALENRPRISAPASMAKYLETSGLFEQQPTLRDGYDATLKEYRSYRDGQQPPLPGMVQDAGGGGAVTVVPPAERAKPDNAYTGWPAAALARIEAKLDAIIRHLSPAGFPDTDAQMGDYRDGADWPDEPPLTPEMWQSMWAGADHNAEQP